MLISWLFFILTLLLLYLSARALTNQIYYSCLRLTHSSSTSLHLLFYLLLPGIFLHEFSHILMAELLRVRTGQLLLQPQLKNNQVRLGSAQIAQTDPFRLSLIGIAPFISGSFCLWALLRFALNLDLHHLSFTSLSQSVQQVPFWLLIIIYWLLFSLANTMFSSASDLKASAIPLILFGLIFASLQLAQTPLPAPLVLLANNLLSLLAAVFLLVFLLNLSLFLILKVVLH
jgi:hypothetical protein